MSIEIKIMTAEQAQSACKTCIIWTWIMFGLTVLFTFGVGIVSFPFYWIIHHILKAVFATVELLQ